ncbi:neuropeptide Y receptor type 2-like [Montipora capricornis]|uniref:neuropeptide Y receptor type 2-like n=1 Tax=Montipora foliosa TaxID=591990 RepID=UPI0035F1FD48
MPEFYKYATNSTGDDDLERISASEVIQVMLYVAITIIGLVGNALIIITLLGRQTRRVGEYLILNLAITDLLTCTVSIPFDLAERLSGGFPFGSILCYLIYPLQTVLMAVSVITLLSMSLERHRVVMTPLRPRILPRTAKIAIAISWMVPCTVIIPYVLVLRLEGKQCMEKWPEDWYVKVFTLTNFALFYVVPLAVITFSYIRAGMKIHKELQRLDYLMEESHRSQVNYTKRRTLQKMRTTKVFIVAVGAFLICMLPTHASWIWHDFGRGWESAYFKDVLIFSNILMYANSASNPFIFGSLRNFSACKCRWKELQGDSSNLCFYELRIGSSKVHVSRKMAMKGRNQVKVRSFSIKNMTRRKTEGV